MSTMMSIKGSWYLFCSENLPMVVPQSELSHLGRPCIQWHLRGQLNTLYTSLHLQLNQFRASLTERLRVEVCIVLLQITVHK